jgi:hypothetical protein
MNPDNLELFHTSFPFVLNGPEWAWNWVEGKSEKDCVPAMWTGFGCCAAFNQRPISMKRQEQIGVWFGDHGSDGDGSTVVANVDQRVVILRGILHSEFRQPTEDFVDLLKMRSREKAVVSKLLIHLILCFCNSIRREHDAVAFDELKLSGTIDSTLNEANDEV